MNFANFLTCSRIFLAVLFTVFIFSSWSFGKFFALFVFVVAALTDYWDGVVARGMGEVSSLGEIMDPIADKLLTLSAFFSFWILNLLPLWMVLVVVVRDIFVTAGRFLMPSGSQGRAARSSGKQKTMLQMLFIIAVLLYLIARQLPQWHSSWNSRALEFIHGGIFLIVLVTVWSGARALFKKAPCEI